MGRCQNYGPFLGPLNTRCRVISRNQKRDHNFDNHTYDCILEMWVLVVGVVRRALLGAVMFGSSHISIYGSGPDRDRIGTNVDATNKQQLVYYL